MTSAAGDSWVGKSGRVWPGTGVGSASLRARSDPGPGPSGNPCAHWLLQTRDRVGAHEFTLTQELLAQMLGVRRGTVSLTAGLLQQAGVIRSTRGRITVPDPDALHEAACDRYDVVQAGYRRATAAPKARPGSPTAT